jgi:hypothetical protein
MCESAFTPTTKEDHATEQLREICQEPTRDEVERGILRMKNNSVRGRHYSSGTNKIWRGRNSRSSPGTD